MALAAMLGGSLGVVGGLAVRETVSNLLCNSFSYLRSMCYACKPLAL